MNPIHLAPREINAVLAGLRIWQVVLVGAITMPESVRAALDDIATNSGEEPALGINDIDTLCERINTI